MPENSDYDVGFKKPPRSTQFRKGQSGNPGGRPRKRQKSSGELASDVLNQKITFTEDGRKKEASLMEVSLRTVAQKAARGDRLGLKFLIDQANEENQKTKPSETYTPDQREIETINRVLKIIEKGKIHPKKSVKRRKPLKRNI